MQSLIYYLFLSFIYMFTLLPFKAIYLISDALYIVMYYLTGYRKDVVLRNLSNSFPEKSPGEIAQISKKFYRRLCDILLESFKILTISKKEILKRCHFVNTSDFDRLYKEKKSVIILTGHYGNWEWASAPIVFQTNYQSGVVIKPLKNKIFNRIIIKMRTRFGTDLIPHNNTIREMIKRKKIATVTVILGDQKPPKNQSYWTTFLNQETGFYSGIETMIKRLNYPLVFCSIKKVKRGYYKIYSKVLFENPKDTKDGEISEAYIRCLETEIRNQPELWLWSHRRWSLKKG